MFKSMMRKELMETLPVMAIAGFLYALILISDAFEYSWASDGVLINQMQRWTTVLHDQFIDVLWMIAFGFAILLGLVQTLTDSVQGTWGYLVHLPPGRRWIISSKLLVGGGVYVACTGLFLLVCVMIGWTRQTAVYPFRWSMMSVYVQISLIGMLVYLATFLTGLRPARWYGSRLLPLAGCGLLVWVLIGVPQWWVYGFAPLLVFCGLLVGVILYVGDVRDYT
ncbi:hypothetical protein Mal52_03380 [Symmachiella dynata]|uniref:ABC-2 family transporter protein n=1 Tax=Symmachiella dynata TaxID=2527995 RepID=A0A517ZHC3_9PLAN|nr:hypothetical protein [Symmachiella dynata]QDU41883.1 hypothetical protein Mal52_03380 [Symmachiella dynata]